MIPILVPIILFSIFMVPFGFAMAPVILVNDVIGKIIFLMMAPMTFMCLFLFFSGFLSTPFHGAIIPGKFARDLKHPVYGPRRLYALCWTSIFYSGPAYFVYLSIPFLKKTMFRLFGYKGSTNFVVYPDTWIRDLPLLSVGEGAYLSNKATIGTNICLINGTILVDKVTIDKKALIGHLSMVGPGVFLGESAEVGVGCTLGIRCQVSKKSKVGGGAGLNHGVVVGEKVEVGPMSYVGTKTIIMDGIRIPGGANIPSGVVISNQEDVSKYQSSETMRLKDNVERLSELYRSHVEHQSPNVILKGT